MSDLIGTGVELGIGVAALVAIGAVLKGIGAGPNVCNVPILGGIVGGNSCFTPGPGGTCPDGKKLVAGVCADANTPQPSLTCANAVATGSVIGKQIFIAPRSEPNGGVLAGVQGGYIDPATGQAVNTEQSYSVYVVPGSGRVPTYVSVGDGYYLTDGNYYLSALC